MQRRNNDLVSIIIPVYNRQDYIRQCLLSCTDQTHRPIEIIVVDDGSKDESRKVILDFFEQHKASLGISAYYFYQENKGASAARNVGITHATGSFIKFVDSDDLLPTTSLQDLFKAFNDEVDVVFGDLISIDDNANPIKNISYDGFNLREPIAATARRSIVTGCLMFRSKCFETSRFDETIEVVQDRELCVKLLVQGFKFKHIPINTYFHRISAENRISGKKWTTENPYRYVHAFNTILSYVKDCDSTVVRNAMHGIARSFWIAGRSLLNAGKYKEASFYFKQAAKVNAGRMPKRWGYRFLAFFVPVIAIERIRSVFKPLSTGNK